MPNYRGQYRLFKENSSEYEQYEEGDIVSYRRRTYSAKTEIQGGERPDRSGDWETLVEADITGIAITADAGLTGTIWTDTGVHYQNITVATGGITTAHIADNAITSSKIADGAILGVDVADGVTLNHPDITGDAEVFGNVYITGTAANQMVSSQRKNPVLSISGTYRDIAVDCGAGGISAGIAKSTFSKVVTNSTAVDSIVSAGGICGPTGTFKNIELVQGLSAQDGLIDGLTGNFNNVVAHGGISASGLTLAATSINYLGAIAGALAISAGKVVVDISQAGAIELDSLTGVSVEGNYVRGYTGAFTSVVLTKGLSAQDGLVEGYTGEFNQLVANSGITAKGISTDNIHVLNGISAGGDLEVKNIWIAEDGYIGVCGDTESIYMNANGGQFIFSATAIDIKQKLRHQGDTDTYLDFQTNELSFVAGGATLAMGTGGLLHIPVGISASGISTDNIHVKSGISAGTLVTGFTAEFTSLVGAKGVSAAGATIGGYWAGQHEEIIGIAIDNGLDVITTGKKGHRIIPYDCEVTEWTVTSSDSGSIQFDINWCTYANWTTTASVGGSGLPSISSATKNQDTSVNWTKTTFDAGNIIEFEVDSVTTLTNCVVSLKIRRTG